LKISGYIPSFNNEKTIADSIKSLKLQSYPIDQIFVVDDGSSDQTVSIAKMCCIDVHCNKKNMGRGFTRAKAIQLAKHEIVVSCDATNELDVNFVRDGITVFTDDSISSVFGRISSKNTRGTVDKWRSMHLFKENAYYETGFVKSDLFITYGTIIRKSHILNVGNFNPNLKHSEDEDLGERLIQNGYSLLSNHDLIVNCNVENSLLEVLERYWRWYIGKNEKMSFMDYLHTIKGSLNPMVINDIKSGNYKCIFISLLCPHYCFFKTLFSRIQLLKTFWTYSLKL
jgi:glycosyltransferase involved in cell wall biosynthesis